MSLVPIVQMQQEEPDTTPPALSGATAAATGETTAYGSIVTDEANGTLYWVVTTSATTPSAADVKAGNDHTGSTAADSGSEAIDATGTKDVAASGLTAETTYHFHFMQEDLAGNQSTVRASNSITTDPLVTPGTETFSADGTFTVPNFNSLTVHVYGAGGGGGGGGISSGVLGGDGGDSSFDPGTPVIGRGGKGGEGRNLGGDGGAGGTAQGGSTNTAGGAGEDHGVFPDNWGGAGGNGAGPDGGAGGARTTAAPQHGINGAVEGGGGSGGVRDISSGGGGGGGGGGYAKKTYVKGQLTPGAEVPVVVGEGGEGGPGFGTATDGGDGARGKVAVVWS